MTEQLNALIHTHTERVEAIEKALDQLGQQIEWAQQHGLEDLEDAYSAGVRVLSAKRKEAVGNLELLRRAAGQ